MRFWLTAVAVLVLLTVSCTNSTATENAGSSESSPPDAVTAPIATAIPLSLPERIVYLIDTNDGNRLTNIIVIDGDTARTVKTYNVRSVPSIAFSEDGLSMFVADSYQTQVTRGDLNGYISSFDTRTGSLLIDDVKLTDRALYKFYPIGDPLFFSSDNGEVLYSLKYGEQGPGEGTLAEIDPVSLEVIREAPYPDCGWRITAQPDEWLCVNISGRVDSGFLATASIIDPIKGFEIRNIAVFQSNRIVEAIKPDNVETLFILSQPATVTTVDLQTGGIAHASLEHDEDQSFGPQGTLATTPDGARLFVGFARENEEHPGFVVSEIRVYDTSSWALLRIMELDDPVMHFAISNDGERLYAVSPFEQSIAIFDTNVLELIGFRTGVGNSPARIVVPPSMNQTIASSGRTN
jgi:DNA-binding beta-propeller fold protein YncE